jgi:hypothetical protein
LTRTCIIEYFGGYTSGFKWFVKYILKSKINITTKYIFTLNEEEIMCGIVGYIGKNNPKNIYCDHCEHYDKSAGVYTGYTCICKQSKHYLANREYYHRCKQFEWKKDADYV